MARCLGRGALVKISELGTGEQVSAKDSQGLFLVDDRLYYIVMLSCSLVHGLNIW